MTAKLASKRGRAAGVIMEDPWTGSSRYQRNRPESASFRSIFLRPLIFEDSGRMGFPGIREDGPL